MGPSALDHSYKDMFEFEDSEDHNDLMVIKQYDEFGNYRQRVLVNHLALFTRQNGYVIEVIIDQCVLNTQAEKHNATDLVHNIDIETGNKDDNEQIVGQ